MAYAINFTNNPAYSDKIKIIKYEDLASSPRDFSFHLSIDWVYTPFSGTFSKLLCLLHFSPEIGLNFSVFNIIELYSMSISPKVFDFALLDNQSPFEWRNEYASIYSEISKDFFRYQLINLRGREIDPCKTFIGAILSFSLHRGKYQ
jgi:hypothetical protein